MIFQKKVQQAFVKSLLAVLLVFSLAGVGAFGVEQANAQSETIVIAQVFNAASASGEWVTLANISDAPIDLAGWKLQDYTSTGSPQTSWTFPSVTIGANSLLVIERSAGASGALAAGVPTIVGGAFNFAAASDRLDLTNPAGALIDGVAWGTGNTVEGFSVALPTGGFKSGMSLERVSRTDTDTAADWAFVAEPQAGVWAPLVDTASPAVLSKYPADGTMIPMTTTAQVKAEFTFGEGQPVGSASLTLKLDDGTTVGSNSSAAPLGGDLYEIVIAATLVPGKVYTAELIITSGTATLNDSWQFSVQLLGQSGVVISEIYPNALDEANSEFFELYNPTNSAIDISGYTFGSTSAAGNENPQGVIPANTWIQPFSYYLVGDAPILADGLGTWDTPDLVVDLTIANSNGAYWIKNASGAFVDRVSWGNNHHGEGTPFPSNPPTGTSLERRANDGSSPLSGESGAELGNGWNSKNNAADFVLRSRPEPQSSKWGEEPREEEVEAFFLSAASF